MEFAACLDSEGAALAEGDRLIAAGDPQGPDQDRLLGLIEPSIDSYLGPIGINMGSCSNTLGRKEALIVSLME